jgi:transcriptional regulator with XRE-family HTH domain
MAKQTIYDRLMQAYAEKYPAEATTQKVVGERLGIAQSDISRYKTGERLPRWERVIGVAVELNIAVEWLLTGRGPKRPIQELPPGIEELLEFWDKLPPEAQSTVIGYAKLTRATTPTGSPDRRSEAHRGLSEASGKPRKKTL